MKNNTFTNRVDRAALYLRRGTTARRAFSDCFEHGDGDAVVVALMRRARKSPDLWSALEVYFKGKIPDQWLELERLHADLPSVKRLSDQQLHYFAVSTGQHPICWSVEGPSHARFFVHETEAKVYAAEVRAGGYKIPDPQRVAMPDSIPALVELLNRVVS